MGVTNCLIPVALLKSGEEISLYRAGRLTAIGIVHHVKVLKSGSVKVTLTDGSSMTYSVHHAFYVWRMPDSGK